MQAVFKKTLVPITVVECKISSVESSSGFLTMGCVRLESKRLTGLDWWPAGQQRMHRTFQIPPLRSEIPHRVTWTLMHFGGLRGEP